MKKLDALFIRACKSENPEVRIVSVYKRFYLRNDMEQEQLNVYLVDILERICTKYNLLNTSDLISGLSPGSHFSKDIKGEAVPYWEKVLSILISKIRLTDVEKVFGEDFPSPLRFRSTL